LRLALPVFMELKIALVLLLSRYDWWITPAESEVTPHYFPARVRDRYRAHFRPLAGTQNSTTA
jgi:hypothetical protein